MERRSFSRLMMEAYGGWSPVKVVAYLPSALTFHKEITSILEPHCVSCHRPGDAEEMVSALFQGGGRFAWVLPKRLRSKPRPSRERVTSTTQHWTKDNPRLPSGLIGPVVLRPQRRIFLLMERSR